MGGQAVRQSGGRWLRLAVGLGGAVLLTAPPADRLSAQVGYDPSHSPFHDVRRGAGLRFATGYLGGDRGTVPVGPSEGPTFGLRFETSLGPVASFTAGFSYGRTTRFIVFPYDSAGKRTKRSEEHTSAELQSRLHLVCRLLLEKKKTAQSTRCQQS